MADGTFDYATFDARGRDHFTLAANLNKMSDDGVSEYWWDLIYRERNKWAKMWIDNLKDGVYDNTLRTIKIPPNTNEAIKFQQIKDILNSGWAKAIFTNSEEEAKVNFEALRTKANSLGLKDIEAYMTTEYARRLAEWK